MIVQQAIQTTDWLRLIANGRPVQTDTKSTLLERGVAVLLDDEGYWSEHLSVTLPPESDRVQPWKIEGGTVNPVIVVLARRYWDACNQSDFKEGPVPIPNAAEAAAEMTRPWLRSGLPLPAWCQKGV